MLEKAITSLKSHPVIIRTIEGALVGGAVVSPLTMLLSNTLHSGYHISELTNTRTLDSLLEAFQPEFLPWALTHAVVAATIAGTVAYFADRAHTVEKNRLQERLRNYHETIDGLEMGFYTSTLEGRFVTVNPAFAKILRYDSVNELMDMPINDLYVDKDERTELVAELRKNRTVREARLSFMRKDGTLVGVQCDAVLDGHIRGFITEISQGHTENLITTCASCYLIRDKSSPGAPWVKPADYLKQHEQEIRRGYDFSHGICPPCMDKLYPADAEK